MWFVVTDRVVWSVGLSVTVVPAKTAEPIEMLFGLTVDYGGPKEARVRRRCTLASSGEYD